MGVGDYAQSVLTQFLSIWSQHVMVDDCQSKLVTVVLGAYQGSVFMPAVVPPVHL